MCEINLQPLPPPLSSKFHFFLSWEGGGADQVHGVKTLLPSGNNKWAKTCLPILLFTGIYQQLKYFNSTLKKYPYH